jgi:hypothetical protein
MNSGAKASATQIRYDLPDEPREDQMIMGFLCRICRCFSGRSSEDEPSAEPPDDASREVESAPEARGKPEGARKPAASK